MKNQKKFFLVMALFLVVFMGSGLVAAQEQVGDTKAANKELCLLGRPIEFNGFIQQEAAIGIDPKYSGKNVTDYSSIQAEWNWHLTDNIDLYGINRLFGDLAYQIQSGKRWFDKANSTPARKSVARKNLQWEFRGKYDREAEVIRELYFDIHTKYVNFRLGKQQVVWGESDGLRLMDFINPQDLRREFNLRDSDEGYEYTRLPQWIAKATYFPPIEPFNIKDLQIELVINPNVKTNRLEAYNAEGGVWAADEPNLPYTVRVQLSDKTRELRLRNTEYAMRIMGNFKEWLFTLNFFYGVQPDAYLVPTGPSLVMPRWDRAFLQLNFDKKYDWRRIVGFTVNHEFSKIRFRGTTSPVLRIESLYEFKKSFINEGSQIGAMAWTGLNPFEKKYKKNFDQIRIMVGFDWPIYIRPLNKTESFFFSSQFFLFRIEGNHGNLVNAPFYFTDAVSQDALPPLPYSKSHKIDPWRVHNEQKYFSFLVNTQYLNKRITPQFLYLHDFNEHAHGIKAKINFNFGSHWRPEFGYMFWRGNHDTGKSFGLFQKNTQLYGKIKYQF